MTNVPTNREGWRNAEAKKAFGPSSSCVQNEEFVRVREAHVALPTKDVAIISVGNYKSYSGRQPYTHATSLTRKCNTYAKQQSHHSTRRTTLLHGRHQQRSCTRQHVPEEPIRISTQRGVGSQRTNRHLPRPRSGSLSQRHGLPRTPLTECYLSASTTLITVFDLKTSVGTPWSPTRPSTSATLAPIPALLTPMPASNSSTQTAALLAKGPGRFRR